MALSPPALAGARRVAPAFAYLSPAAAALLGLGRRHCRWPLGEPAEAGFAFCGLLTEARGTYCALHARTARSTARKREAEQ